MPPRKILFIGPVRDSSRALVKALRDVEATVIALLPNGAKEGEFGDDVLIDTADFRNIESVCEKAQALHQQHRFSKVATGYEFNIEIAAAVRSRLALPGLHPENASKVRNKFEMARFFSNHGFTFPKTCRYPIEPQDVVPPLPWILKPAAGGANLGVTFISESERAAELYVNAVKSVSASPFQSTTSTNICSDWILTEFIDGPEFEANLVVRGGNVLFSCIMQKRSKEVFGKLFEVRMVTPPIDDFLVPKVDTFLKDLATVVYEQIARPSGDEQFLLYPEFRIRDGQIYCLEIAYRAGGTADAVRRSTGVDLDKVSAEILVERRLDFSGLKSPRGICFQILYSSVAGVLKRVIGHPPVSDRYENIIAEGRNIQVPQSDYVAFLTEEADTAKQAEAKMETSVSQIHLVVETTPGMEVVVPMKDFSFETSGA